jgi:hypothetical protein
MVTSRKLKQQAKFARGGAVSALAFAPNFIVLFDRCQLDRFGATYHFARSFGAIRNESRSRKID